MKQELYHYAISLKKKQLSNIPIICVWILLIIFFIPVFLSNIWIGLVILFSYSLFYFCSKKESDKYSRGLINFGLFILFFGLECSILVIIQYNVIEFLVATIVVLTILYEIFWIVKIIKNMYSRCVQKKRTWDYIFLLIFGGTGIWCGKLIASSEQINFKLVIAILLCSILIVGSFSFFQKYFILKIIERQTNY